MPTRIRIHRSGRDRSQSWRRVAQLLFLALNVWIGLQFLFFVRSFESGERAIQVARPPGVEGWLPIAGLMNLKYLLSTGHVPSIHPAAMFLLIAFLIISIVFRKAFCSWLCPVGTISEGLWKFGRELLKHNWKLPRKVDVPLRGLKYLLLALFVYAIAGMPAAAIEAFMVSPYGLVADVKMLDFFLNLSRTAAIFLAALIVLSIFFQNFWCRYLCPYGALMGLAALLSPAGIGRDREKCVECGKCAVACPALLRVNELVNVQSAECMSCMECVAACPAEGALQMTFLRKRRVAPWVTACGLAAILVAVIGIARWNDTWHSNIPDHVYRQLIPRLKSLSHP